MLWLVVPQNWNKVGLNLKLSICLLTQRFSFIHLGGHYVAFFVAKEVIGNQWLVWDLTTSRKKAVKYEQCLNNLCCFPACFCWLHFHFHQWRDISSAETSPTMSCSPSFSLTPYHSLPPNQMLTSLAPFSLAHRRRRTCTYTHVGPLGSCDF